MEDENESISASESSDSGDDFTCDPDDELDSKSSTSDNGDLDYKSSTSDNDDENTNKDDANHGTSALNSSILSASRSQDRKSQNVAALIEGNLEVKRKSWLPRVYSVTETAASLRKPFKSPCSNSNSDIDGHLARRLCARKRFVPWGSTRPVLLAITNRLNVPEAPEISVEEEIVDLPPGVEPLVLWQAEESDCNLAVIAVDPLLVNFLRPHQREGVQFMFDCVSGILSDANINGCILADDMGLGKTLQSITLLYTLLHQGFDGNPIVKKAIIVTPTSLVSNWEAEINKWLGGRVKLVALCESTREDAISSINSFVSSRSNLQVLIVSYETFRMHSSKFSGSGSCDLLICDEAHRLKNDQTMTNRSLAALTCKRRLLLSGTPMQNDLEEFYAMANFTNPGVLGDASHFRRHYEMPIICGREPTATEEEKRLGSERSTELSAKVNQFILRRTNALLSNHLPPKIIEVVCCKLTPLQSNLYNHIIQSKNVKQAITEETRKSKILAFITALKKLCNHPKLIYDTIKSGKPGTSGLEDCLRFFPSEMFSGRSGAWTGGDGLWVELSGKMHVLARLLAHLRQKTDDRIVLVSNYTQTLDLFAQLCRERRYPFLRLDGSTTINKRQKLVNCFNDMSKDEFAFLLSSKAGGCGLNLIGGNRLVLFDPDWNPANDKQAAARVWRDGQKKRVFIYRFLSTGTIEEKVYQRQMSKEGLQNVIQQESIESEGNLLSAEDLRDLFTFREDLSSEIHEKLSCNRCGVDTEKEAKTNSENIPCNSDQEDIGSFASVAGCLNKLKDSEKQVGTPKEEDLANWGHHFTPSSVPDPIFQSAAGDEVSFVFTNQVGGKLVPVESKARPNAQQNNNNNNNNVKSCMEKKQIFRKENIIPRKAITMMPPQQKQSVSKNKTVSSLISSKIHLPHKRLSPDTPNDDDDDDFV